MSFNSIEIKGEVLSEKTVERETVDTEGNVLSTEEVNRQIMDASQVTLECGDQTITLRGAITELLRKSGVKSGVVRVDIPGRPTFEVTSEKSAHLTDPETGEDSPLPEGAVLTPVHTGKAF